MQAGLPSIWFWTGVVFLLINPVIGWGGLSICTLLGKKTGKKFYYKIGLGIYGLSWLILGLGIVLAGREGKRYCREFWYYVLHSRYVVILLVIGVILLLWLGRILIIRIRHRL